MNKMRLHFSNIKNMNTMITTTYYNINKHRNTNRLTLNNDIKQINLPVVVSANCKNKIYNNNTK